MTPWHIKEIKPKSMDKNPKKLVFLALMTSLAMVLQIVETLIPIPVPWIRLGLANILILIVLSIFGLKEGLMVAGVRILMASIFMGTIFGPTFWLSLSGGLMSTLGMGLLIQFFPRCFSIIGISIFGAYIHNLTQLTVASLFIIGQPGVFNLLPLLMITALIAGLITGMTATLVIERLQVEWIGQT